MTDLSEPLNNRGSKDNAFLPTVGAFIAVLGSLSFGYCLAMTSPALPSMTHEGVNNALPSLFDSDCTKLNGKMVETSPKADLFGSILNVGCIFGAMVAGFLLDAIGRKFTIVFSAIPMGTGWMLIGMGKSFIVVFVGRILCGVAVGIASMAVPVYIAETAPTRLRGVLGCVNQFAVVCGIMLVYTIGAVLRHTENTCTGTKNYLEDWRLIAWVAAGMAGATIVFVSFLPASPNWLVSKNNTDQALANIKKLRGGQYDSEKELSKLIANQPKAGSEGKWSDLFSIEMREPMIIGIGIMFCQQFGGINAVIFFSGQIFASAGVSDPDKCALYLGAVQILFTGVGALLVDKCGRKVLLLFAACGEMVFAGTLGLFFYINKDVGDGGTTQYSWLAITSLCGYIATFSCGMGGIPWLLMSEIFPSKMRGKASGVVTVINWSLAFIVTETFATLEHVLQPYGTFFLFSGMSFLSVVFIYFVVQETKGQSLEALEEFFIERSTPRASRQRKSPSFPRDDSPRSNHSARYESPRSTGRSGR